IRSSACNIVEAASSACLEAAHNRLPKTFPTPSDRSQGNLSTRLAKPCFVSHKSKGSLATHLSPSFRLSHRRLPDRPCRPRSQPSKRASLESAGKFCEHDQRLN